MNSSREASLSLLSVNVELESLWTYVETMSSSLLPRYKWTLRAYSSQMKAEEKSLHLPGGLLENTVCHSHQVAAKINEKFHFRVRFY